MYLEQFLEKVAEAESYDSDLVKLAAEDVKMTEAVSEAYLIGFQEGMIKEASKWLAIRKRLGKFIMGKKNLNAIEQEIANKYEQALRTAISNKKKYDLFKLLGASATGAGFGYFGSRFLMDRK